MMTKKLAAVLSTEIALTMMVGVIVLFVALAIFSSNTGYIFKNSNMKKLFNKQNVEETVPPRSEDLSILHAGMQGSILINDFKVLLAKINEVLNSSSDYPGGYIATLNALKQSILMAIATNDDYKRVSLSKNKQEILQTEVLLTNSIKDVFDRIADVDKTMKEIALADYNQLDKITSGGSSAFIRMEVDPALASALSKTSVEKAAHIEEFYNGEVLAVVDSVASVNSFGEKVFAPEPEPKPSSALNLRTDLFINEPDSGLNGIQLHFGNDSNDWIFLPNPHPLKDLFTSLNDLLNDKNLTDAKIATFLDGVIMQDADKPCTEGGSKYLLDKETYNEPYDAHLEGTFHVGGTGISNTTKYCSNRLSRHISSLIAIEQFQDVWVFQLVYWHLNKGEVERASALMSKYADRFTDEYLTRHFRPEGSLTYSGGVVNAFNSAVSTSYIDIAKLLYQITKACVKYRLNKSIASDIKPELLKVKTLVEKYATGKDLTKQEDVATLYTEIMSSKEKTEDKVLLNNYVKFRVVY